MGSKMAGQGMWPVFVGIAVFFGGWSSVLASDHPSVASGAAASSQGAAAVVVDNTATGCLGGPEVLQLLTASKSDFCSTHALSGAGDGQKCFVDMPTIPCNQMATTIFYAYSGKQPLKRPLRFDAFFSAPTRTLDPRERDTARKLFKSRDSLMKYLRLMEQQTADKKLVFMFQMAFSQSEKYANTDDNKCGGVHVFAVVKWPTVTGPAADKADADAPPSEQLSCLLQSFVSSSGHYVGYSLRQWVYGYDVAHEEQDKTRADLHMTDKAVFEAARQASGGPRKFTDFLTSFEQLLHAETSRATFTRMFGCDPGHRVLADLVTVTVKPVDESLAGFTTIIQNAKQCSHGHGH